MRTQLGPSQNISWHILHRMSKAEGTGISSFNRPLLTVTGAELIHRFKLKNERTGSRNRELKGPLLKGFPLAYWHGTC